MSNILKMVTESQLWPIEKLIPYANNARTHSKRQIKLLAAIMRSHGMIGSVWVDSRGVLIAGHARVLAAQLNGLTHISVIVLDHLTDNEARKLRIADNKIAQSAGCDKKKLYAELARLLEQHADLESLGFSELELKDVLAKLGVEGRTDEDEIPAVPINTTTKVGDLWILGDHQILCADATELPNAKRLLKGQPADMIFLDFPYNVQYRGKAAGTQDTILNDDLGADFSSFLKKACDVILAVSGGGIYMCMSSSELHTLYSAFTSAGGHWSTFVIWAKDRFTLGRSDFQRQYEPILYGWKEGSPHAWYGSRNMGDVWNFDKPRANKLHPTMKPVELVERAILCSSEPGNTVFDPFGGSGSTLIACHKTGRRGRLMELAPKYVDVTIERWQAYSGETARLESNGQLFNEFARDEKKAA
jgi:DNA modification methylase